MNLPTLVGSGSVTKALNYCLSHNPVNVSTDKPDQDAYPADFIIYTLSRALESLEERGKKLEPSLDTEVLVHSSLQLLKIALTRNKTYAAMFLLEQLSYAYENSEGFRAQIKSILEGARASIGDDSNAISQAISEILDDTYQINFSIDNSELSIALAKGRNMPLYWSPYGYKMEEGKLVAREGEHPYDCLYDLLAVTLKRNSSAADSLGSIKIDPSVPLDAMAINDLNHFISSGQIYQKVSLSFAINERENLTYTRELIDLTTNPKISRIEIKNEGVRFELLQAILNNSYEEVKEVILRCEKNNEVASALKMEGALADTFRTALIAENLEGEIIELIVEQTLRQALVEKNTNLASSLISTETGSFLSLICTKLGKDPSSLRYALLYNQSACDGFTLLQWAITSGNVDKIAHLFEQDNFKINAAGVTSGKAGLFKSIFQLTDENGNTFLHQLAASGHHSTIKRLFDEGWHRHHTFKVDARSKSNKTPLEVAEESGHPECAVEIELIHPEMGYDTAYAHTLEVLQQCLKTLTQAKKIKFRDQSSSDTIVTYDDLEGLDSDLDAISETVLRYFMNETENETAVTVEELLVQCFNHAITSLYSGENLIGNVTTEESDGHYTISDNRFSLYVEDAQQVLSPVVRRMSALREYQNSL